MYSFATRLDCDVVEAESKVVAALKEEGFGVLTEIDVQATLKAKLGVERPPYLILGACNPPAAHRALTALPSVGILLPCNVTVSVEQGDTVVRAMNPGVALGMLDHPELEKVAAEVGASLQRVVQSMESDPQGR